MLREMQHWEPQGWIVWREMHEQVDKLMQCPCSATETPRCPKCHAPTMPYELAWRSVFNPPQQEPTETNG